MNITDVSKREVLDFKQFLGKVHDDKYYQKLILWFHIMQY